MEPRALVPFSTSIESLREVGFLLTVIFSSPFRLDFFVLFLFVTVGYKGWGLSFNVLNLGFVFYYAAFFQKQAA
ncbi:hypothetical protein [uncultured Phascolarctobacterium sp.]|uniref:hypothetical protein n=1 Tax=uncultured Phascolarctobacterium sp. TaxID=512296 RepID=UPI0027D97217|nr:hypothetical protein [uncultured Phascolarctobacterium sp.]